MNHHRRTLWKCGVSRALNRPNRVLRIGVRGPDVGLARAEHVAVSPADVNLLSSACSEGRVGSSRLADRRVRRSGDRPAPRWRRAAGVAPDGCFACRRRGTDAADGVASSAAACHDSIALPLDTYRTSALRGAFSFLTFGTDSCKSRGHADLRPGAGCLFLAGRVGAYARNRARTRAILCGIGGTVEPSVRTMDNQRPRRSGNCVLRRGCAIGSCQCPQWCTGG